MPLPPFASRQLADLGARVIKVDVAQAKAILQGGMTRVDLPSLSLCLGQSPQLKASRSI